MYVIVNEPTYDIWGDVTKEYNVPVISDTNPWENSHQPSPELLNEVIIEAETDMEAAVIIDEKLNAIFEDIDDELVGALSKFPAFNSAHEGFSVLKEEVDELWDEVKAKQGARDIAKLRKEAVQVAAMAVRFILDVCDGERGQR